MSQPWVLLDFDNTLMATEKIALPSLIKRFNDLYGAQIDHPLTLEEFKENFHGQARENLCANLSKHFGINVEFPVLFEDREWFIMKMYQEVGVEMAPGLLDALDRIEAMGARLAIVTNNPVQRALAAMRYATNNEGERLARKFGSACFESGTKQKPLPHVYQRAMEQLSTTPECCLAVEDSVTGVKSARAANIPTIAYTGLSDNPEATQAKLTELGAKESFEHWTDFPDLLKAYL